MLQLLLVFHYLNPFRSGTRSRVLRVIGFFAHDHVHDHEKSSQLRTITITNTITIVRDREITDHAEH